MRKLGPNYPKYQTTIIHDFRHMIDQIAERKPDGVAYSYKPNPREEEIVRVTYAEVQKDTQNLGTSLVARYGHGAKIAIISELSYRQILAYYAVMATGNVSVPLDKEWTAEDLTGAVRKADCRAIFYSPSIREKIEEIRKDCPDADYIVLKDGDEGELSADQLLAEGEALREDGDRSYEFYELDPDAMASIVFTSGTTGKGKGVMLSTNNICRDMTQGMYNFAITDRTLVVLPPHHTFCSTIMFVGHFAQGSEMFLTSGLKYLLPELKEQKPTHLVLVPLFIETIYKRIWQNAEKNGKADTLRKGLKMAALLRKIGIDRRREIFKDVLDVFGGELRMIICGGAALHQDIIDFFEGVGITIMNGYGITECAPLVSCNRNEFQKKGSVGCPIVGEEVRILDPDENGEGEICVKGVNVMQGYYEDPDATAAAFTEDGYFKTGDYGKLDEDGWLYITGRLKNLIIFSNGKNVYPEEIETEISGIPGVNEVVVYAGESVSNAKKEVIVAEIYPDEDTLLSHGITDYKDYFTGEIAKLNRKMVSYKAVGLVKIRKTEFPKNSSKKITRFNLDKKID
ncbi:MAG: AMP-binding protein, partial [Clostridia bacterium]|nr:AMP-binding protein [Clostridia bacterium]